MKVVWFFLLISHLGLSQTDDNTQQTSGAYGGIAGNPYFIKDWSEGIIRFSSGKVTDKFKLRFNVAQNRLILQFQGSSFGAESNIIEFVIFNKNKKDSFLFRKGFPQADRGNKETFYRVLEQGSATLLVLIVKDIVQEKEVIPTKSSRHYTDVEVFYILKDGSMHKIDSETTTLPDILSDRREELKSYISEQHLRMRSAADLVKVVKKYNELRNN